MTILTPDRRSLLKGGATLLAAAATMSSEQLLGYAPGDDAFADRD